MIPRICWLERGSLAERPTMIQAHTSEAPAPAPSAPTPQEQARAAATRLGTQNSEEDPLAELNMEDYDEENVDLIASCTGGMLDVENIEDLGQNVDEDDYTFNTTDDVVITVRVDSSNERSLVEVYVFDTERQNLYVHHDFL